MAKVSLRIYNREIESLIDQGHLDEAVAHCHHILQTFPKHLETYRLLGKAYLESKQHGEAVDIFSRVLMAVPDDFVSHVGMSIIRDDESKLDDSIWHMERAFESQPSNAAIQGELQRLYGRRDGVEPPKIRMTRGALAHMYVQGELYPQAISEIRAVLSQDPQRADMQVLLARAFFRGGQKADASDMCSQLLKRYPYCFDANRIMVELIPASDRAESTQVYRHRVNELDPYSMFAKESIFRSDEVTDASVNLERLEYTGESVEVAPDWGTSLGIGLASGSSISSEQPDWLKAGLSESQPELSAASPSEPAPVSQSDSGIPDFLRQAGWTESSGAAEEPAPLDSSPADELAPANIPDWLKNQMPAEAAQPPKQAATPGDVPDWLSGLGPSESAATGAVSSSDIPDWLNEIDKRQSEQPAPEVESKQSEPAHAEPSKPAPPAASLETLGTSEKEQDDAVAWLEMLAAKHGAKPEELITDPNARTETPPEWVEQARSIAESQPTEGPVTHEPAQDETGMWLHDLAEKEPPGLVSEEGKSNIPDQEIPDWLSGFESKPSEAQPASEPIPEEPLAQADVPDWLSGMKNEPVAEPVSEEPVEQKSDLPDWLGGMQEESGVGREESAAGEPEQQDISEWLSELDKESPAMQSISKPKTQPLSPEPPKIPDWLSSLESSSGQGMEEQTEALPEEPAATPLPGTEEPAPLPPVAAELPEWLRGIDETQAEALPEEPAAAPLPGTEEPAPLPPAAELPEWLRGIDETKPEEPTEEAPESLPSWLRSDFEEEEPRPASITSADWHPAEPEPESPAPTPEPPPMPRPIQPSIAMGHPEPPPPDVRSLVPSDREKPAPRPAPVQKVERPVRARQVESLQVSAEALSQAQGELNRGDIPAAVDRYNRLIKRGKHLDETIRDLRESLYRYPVEVSIWQALGDAYMRANRLQEALDAYNKAEELLR